MSVIIWLSLLKKKQKLKHSLSSMTAFLLSVSHVIVHDFHDLTNQLHALDPHTYTSPASSELQTYASHCPFDGSACVSHDRVV